MREFQVVMRLRPDAQLIKMADASGTDNSAVALGGDRAGGAR